MDFAMLENGKWERDKGRRGMRVTFDEEIHLIVSIALNENGDRFFDDDWLRDCDWNWMSDRNRDWVRHWNLKI
jgi:hypothetical protein